MEIAIVALIAVVIGYLMGRQSTKDKQRVVEGKPLEKISIKPEFLKEHKEAETDPIMDGFANMMMYDGEEQS